MTRWADDDEEDDDEDRDEEPSSVDQEASEAEDREGFGEMPCPYCGEPMSDLAEVCPRCGSFISREDVPRERRPKWVVVVTVLLLIALTIGAVSFR